MYKILNAFRKICRALFVFPWDLCRDCEGNEFCAECGMALRFY